MKNFPRSLAILGIVTIIAGFIYDIITFIGIYHPKKKAPSLNCLQ